MPDRHLPTSPSTTTPTPEPTPEPNPEPSPESTPAAGPGRRVRFLAPVPVLAAIVSAVALGGTAGPASTSASAPSAVASTSPRAVVRPEIAFDRLEHGFGSMWEGEQATTTFTFRNAGDQTLVIQAIRASCGCTTTELSQDRFGPGEGDQITVNFDAKGRGEQRKTITVVTNAGPPLQLAITATVRQFLTAEPAVLRLGDLTMGEPRTARLRITSADPSFTPERVQVLGAAARVVSARLVDAEESAESTGAGAGERPAGPMLPGRSRGPAGGTAASPPPGEGAFDVEVTVGPDAPWGSLFATLRVSGRGTKPGDPAGRTRHVHDVTVSGRVFGEVIASDTMVRVSRVPAGKPFQRVIRFQSRSGQPLPLQSARLINPSLPSMTATLEPEAGSEGRRWRLVVQADAGTEPGRVTGSLVVRTAVPGEDRLTFLVAGMVAPPGE